LASAGSTCCPADRALRAHRNRICDEGRSELALQTHQFGLSGPGLSWCHLVSEPSAIALALDLRLCTRRCAQSCTDLGRTPAIRLMFGHVCLVSRPGRCPKRAHRPSADERCRTISSAPIVANATFVKVGLQAVSVGIRPLPPRNRFFTPQTRQVGSQTFDPSS
jgi:hypothetical protein